VLVQYDTTWSDSDNVPAKAVTRAEGP
jgi:hypothetical protein